jgi:hypothetical protein
MPSAHNAAMTAPRSRRLHASRTSLRVQTRRTTSRTIGVCIVMTGFLFPLVSRLGWRQLFALTYLKKR